MFEVDEAARTISNATDADANIIFGAVVKNELADQVRITVIATGFDETQARIAKMTRPMDTTRMEGLVSDSLKKDDPLIDDHKTEEEEQEVPSDSDEKDEFGEDFEIPAFLRKMH
jgi:cell division protein FtsZ